MKTATSRNLPLPLTIDEQIDNLRKLGLIIEDENKAEYFLQSVSYFRFVKGYSIGLKQPDGNYIPGVSFEQLMQLYQFNAEFRLLLFAQIERIEVGLRCRLSNHFSLKYGSMGYTNPSNFSKYSEKFRDRIEKEIKRYTHSPLVHNFNERYENGNVPLFAAVERFSFGALSRFYKNLKGEDKKEIAATYSMNYGYFESWLENITNIRNVCAHYERLYNVRYIKSIHLYSQDRDFGIENNTVMATLVCMKRILQCDNQWREFVESLARLIEKYPAVQISRMGFPQEWKSILINA